jgi:hypothetical protein
MGYGVWHEKTGMFGPGFQFKSQNESASYPTVKTLRRSP